MNTRRDFLVKCGAGMGALITSNLWLDKVFAGVTTGKDIHSDKFFGISKEEMQKLLGIALSKGGDFSELFFEYRISTSVTMSEDIIKSSSENIGMGVGVRVINGEQTGYGFTNEINFEKIRDTALTAAAIASGQGKVNIANLNVEVPSVVAYNMNNPLYDKAIDYKINLIKDAYKSAQNYDRRIVMIDSSFADEVQYVTIANSEGLLISDVRPQARLMVVATAQEKGNKTTAFANAGGRVGADFYTPGDTPEKVGKKAAEEAIILLGADSAKPGEQTVVLGSNQSGVMIHEAVGHPLEADGAWKKSSIMWDKVGQEVANPIVTIYDDATIPDFRGSLNIDDEGTQTEKVVLIEKGKLLRFMNDRLAAKIMKTEPNGHGRRQSYRNPPIPRMNNTVLLRGEHDPQEIIESVKSGFYALTYEGGMVSNTGKFTFSVNFGYLIENGKLTKPLRNATLIGQNTDILKNVDMVGNDMGFFLGTCGKDGQSVPVTAGTATLRIKKMTVGGKA